METTSNAYRQAHQPFYGLVKGPIPEHNTARGVQAVLRKADTKGGVNKWLQGSTNWSSEKSEICAIMRGWNSYMPF